MRPLTLEVSGFTTFREPTQVDFDGVDFFALVGPTGSGKSSIIDALCFALYGKVPRLPQSSVEPVISQGKQEARIRLDFAIGEQRYTAARVVRRIAGGASTKEARLERGDEVLAGDADGVSAEVERLLGLGFAQFTRCVVLPQGEFARFMHDKPAERQELLVKLLDLAVYGRMAQRANQRSAIAEAELSVQRRRLDEELSFATAEEMAAARARHQLLETLRDRIEADEPMLEQLRETVRSGREEAQRARDAAAALAGIRIPDGIEELATVLTSAQAAAKAAEDAADAADEDAAKADAVRAALPDRTELAGALEAHRRRAELAGELETCRTQTERAHEQLEAAARAVAAAETDQHQKSHTLEAARIQHRALDLAQTLTVGEPCPVCRQNVAALPAIDVPADLERAQTDADAAAVEVGAAQKARAAAETAAAKAAARLDAIGEQLTALEARLGEHPDLAVVEAALTEVEAAEAALLAAHAAAKESRARATATRRMVEQALHTLTDARQTLAAARDRVAHLSPPPLNHDDLGEDWRVFVGWATEERARQDAAAAAADARAAEAGARGSEIAAAHRAACAEAGIDEDGSPRDDCLKAIERQRATIERLELALEEAERIRTEVASLEERHVVARELGKHLKASGFERWVLKQALTSLTDGATQLLQDLTGGQYSLTLDKNFGFAVIDHRNADAVRSAKTLSGGETFLASLALALAMSDRIAQLSANTAVRLESIFLDEGFGTLDPETLETVATAIESLASGSRVVGIVTHVRELAERVPVRYEVRKGPTTSTVERVG